MGIFDKFFSKKNENSDSEKVIENSKDSNLNSRENAKGDSKVDLVSSLLGLRAVVNLNPFDPVIFSEKLNNFYEASPSKDVFVRKLVEIQISKFDANGFLLLKEVLTFLKSKSLDLKIVDAYCNDSFAFLKSMNDEPKMFKFFIVVLNVLHLEKLVFFENNYSMLIEKYDVFSYSNLFWKEFGNSLKIVNSDKVYDDFLSLYEKNLHSKSPSDLLMKLCILFGYSSADNLEKFVSSIDSGSVVISSDVKLLLFSIHASFNDWNTYKKNSFKGSISDYFATIADGIFKKYIK